MPKTHLYCRSAILSHPLASRPLLPRNTTTLGGAGLREEGREMKRGDSMRTRQLSARLPIAFLMAWHISGANTAETISMYVLGRQPQSLSPDPPPSLGTTRLPRQSRMLTLPLAAAGRLPRGRAAMSRGKGERWTRYQTACSRDLLVSGVAVCRDDNPLNACMSGPSTGKAGLKRECVSDSH
jgi:hypothetical protein